MYDYAIIKYRTLDLNPAANNSPHVFWSTIGMDTIVVQIARVVGTATAWVVTIERSNNGEDWDGMSTALTIDFNDNGSSGRVPIESAWMRARVSTAEGSAATGEVAVYMSADWGSGKDLSAKYQATMKGNVN